MNQNHLHLHVNVTNSDFQMFDKTGRKTAISESENSAENFSGVKGVGSARNQTFRKEKIKVKKNNVQYTPLTLNGILKDQNGVKAKLQGRLKTKSGDLGALGLSNSVLAKAQMNNSTSKLPMNAKGK